MLVPVDGYKQKQLKNWPNYFNFFPVKLQKKLLNLKFLHTNLIHSQTTANTHLAHTKVYWYRQFPKNAF